MKPSPHTIIEKLLDSMDGVRDRTDEELKSAFLDVESDPVIRDTAQVILEARAFIKKHDQLRESVRRLVGEWREKAVKLTDIQKRNEVNILGPAAMGSAGAFEVCAKELEAFLAENKELSES